MTFFVLYLFIPFFLFLLKPVKSNKWLILYVLLLALLSYDNVTDYYFFLNQFRGIQNNAAYYSANLKGLELGWVFIYKLFSFTEYGFVIIHSIVFFFVILFFLKYSRKIGLLNVSIFLLFVLEAFTKHDNILRQNIPILMSTYLFFDFLNGSSWNIKRLVKILLVTSGAFFLHYSAILIIPYCFFVKWLVNKRLKFGLVFPVVLLLDTMRATGFANTILLRIMLLLPSENVNYLEYYVKLIMDANIKGVSFGGFVFMFVSITPLFYFTTFRKVEYETNRILRLSVNITCIIMTLRYFVMDIPIFTRVFDYLIWFEIWGIGFMINDIFSNKKITYHAKIFVWVVIFVLLIKHWAKISDQYGNNNYMTILTDECKKQMIYDRNPFYRDKKRVRE